MEEDVKRGRNNQLWDLGLELSKMGEDQDVKDKIMSLDDELDQVLILEKMDESLILMAQSLCWSLRQVHNLDLYYGWVIISPSGEIRPAQQPDE